MVSPAILQGWSRETTIVRDAEGRWFHDGQALEHFNLERAFDRWVSRADDGRYCLKNEINWAYITLHGAPFFVRALSIEPTERVQLKLSDDRVVPLVASSLRADTLGALYCDVGDGMVARFDRHAAQQLEPLIGEDEQGIYVRLDGERVRPPVVDNPLSPMSASPESSPRPRNPPALSSRQRSPAPSGSQPRS
jgi:hypothetical protein